MFVNTLEKNIITIITGDNMTDFMLYFKATSYKDIPILFRQ
jgi:hypothetical protein